MKNKTSSRAILVLAIAGVMLAGTPRPSHASIFGDIWSGITSIGSFMWNDIIDPVLDNVDPWGLHAQWHENRGDVPNPAYTN